MMIVKVRLDAGENAIFTEDAVAALVGTKASVAVLGRSSEGVVDSIEHRHVNDDGHIIAVDVIVRLS